MSRLPVNFNILNIENCKNNWHFTNDPSCVVLYSLQFLDAAAWSAVEHSFAVVDPKFRDFLFTVGYIGYNVHKDFRTDSTDSPGCLPTLVSLSVFAFYFFFFPFLVVGFLW